MQVDIHKLFLSTLKALLLIFHRNFHLSNIIYPVSIVEIEGGNKIIPIFQHPISGKTLFSNSGWIFVYFVLEIYWTEKGKYIFVPFYS